MTGSVNPNTVSLYSTDSEFLLNPNSPVEDIYLGIVSNMLELPVKVILYANQVRAAGIFYDDKPWNFDGKQ